MRLAEAAYVVEEGGTPDEHPAGQIAVRGRYGSVQQSQTFLAAARPRERQPQGRLHVHFPLGPTGRPGQPYRLLQLGDRSWEVSAIAQDDPDSVVSQRGVIRTGLAS